MYMIFILLFIIHVANIFTIIFLKDQILDSSEIFDSQLERIQNFVDINWKEITEKLKICIVHMTHDI